MNRTHDDILPFAARLNLYGHSWEERRQLRNLQFLHNSKFMARLGIQQDDVDKLSCIHVAGTKGKGSTSAITESILRAHGFKTGLFTSPHVVEFRERLKINGKALPRDHFTHEFFKINDELQATQDQCTGESVIPTTGSQYLWFMALRIFIAEKVDVAIIEVSIGGERDYTNNIRNPVVCGITTLDLDHTEYLGNTLREIAWCKAGIFKEGTPAFIEPQPMEALDVIAERAVERKCPVHLVPDFSAYYWRGEETKPGLDGEVQKLNASLAIQMAHTWIQLHDKPESIRRKPFVRQSSFTGKDIPLAPVFEVDDKTKQGLMKSFLAGRHHMIKRGKITYFCDVAHTPISVGHAVKWFALKSEEEAIGMGKVAKVFVANVTPDRSAKDILGQLMPFEFDAVVFSPSFIDDKVQRWNESMADELTKHSAELVSVWKNMKKEIGAEQSLTFWLPHVSAAIDWITGKTGGNNKIPSLPESVKSADHVQVFVACCFRLVGNTIGVLDPECNI